MAGKREEEREREGGGFDGRAPVYWTLAACFQTTCW